jgi:hypothetical protein
MISIRYLFDIENYPANEVGKHRDVPITKYCPKQVKIGLEIEKEHSDNPEIAGQITKDHLAEFPDYYTRLLKLEKEAKKAKGE